MYQVELYLKNHLVEYGECGSSGYLTRNGNKLAAVQRTLAKSSKVTHIKGLIVSNHLPYTSRLSLVLPCARRIL